MQVSGKTLSLAASREALTYSLGARAAPLLDVLEEIEMVEAQPRKLGRQSRRVWSAVVPFI
jgi:hypothetical protein